MRSAQLEELNPTRTIKPFAPVGWVDVALIGRACGFNTNAPRFELRVTDV